MNSRKSLIGILWLLTTLSACSGEAQQPRGPIDSLCPNCAVLRQQSGGETSDFDGSELPCTVARSKATREDLEQFEVSALREMLSQDQEGTLNWRHADSQVKVEQLPELTTMTLSVELSNFELVTLTPFPGVSEEDARICADQVYGDALIHLRTADGSVVATLEGGVVRSLNELDWALWGKTDLALASGTPRAPNRPQSAALRFHLPPGGPVSDQLSGLPGAEVWIPRRS